MIYWKGIHGALVEVERTRTYSRVNLAEENAFNSLQISDYFKCVEFQSEYFLQNKFAYVIQSGSVCCSGKVSDK